MNFKEAQKFKLSFSNNVIIVNSKTMDIKITPSKRDDFKIL
jgi:hypothetical protein